MNVLGRIQIEKITEVVVHVAPVVQFHQNDIIIYGDIAIYFIKLSKVLKLRIPLVKWFNNLNSILIPTKINKVSAMSIKNSQ